MIAGHVVTAADVGRMAPPRVRRATEADLALVVELRLALLREYGDHPVYGRIRSDAEHRAAPFYASQLRDHDQAMFIAEQGGDVVGIVRCAEIVGSPVLRPERYCYVSSAYVRPDARRQGVLSSLMEAAERWALARGLHEMRLHNSSSSAAAMATWDAMGFEVVEQVRRRAIG
jgi:ribosomal protein S18 acetylase RimI-like enzyme